MANRKILTVFRRAFALVVIVAVAALSWLALSFTPKKAHADEVEAQAQTHPTHDSVFGANHANSRPFSLSDEEIVFVEPGKYGWADKYFLKPSTFHLTKDEEISNCLQMIASYFGDDTYITVNICLHGHSLTYKSSYAIDMAGDCTLNIYDCGGDDNHSGSMCGLHVINGAEANLYSGAIKGYKDSGVSVYGKSNGKNATFNMYGGEISGNGTQGTLSGGGGVSIGADGVFNMYGGTICDNTVKEQHGGGVRVGMASSTFHMYGGTITGNTLTIKETSDDEVVDWYHGAGVYNNGGTFTMQGNVNISGNVKGKPSALSANNAEVFYKTNSDGSPVKDYEGNILYDGKIKITGALGAGSQIGITAEPGRVVTSGYTDSGNTQNPSVFFNCDNSDYSIGFDEDLGKEAAVYEGSVVVGNFTMKSATATSHVGTPHVGDTSIGLNIDVLLENEDGATKTVHDVKTVTCSPLHVGNNVVSFDYEYKGVTKHLTYTVTLAKVNATVSWSCTDAATTVSGSAATRAHDGTDILNKITASYTSYSGTTVDVVGTSSGMTVKKNGTVVNSVADVGTYTLSLADSSEYEFYNNSFTLTVTDEPVDDGYYKMKDATAIGVEGAPTVGDTSVVVSIRRTLEHTKGQPDKTETVSSGITLSTPLKVGDNKLQFTYKYTDAAGDSQTKQLSITVTAGKKQVAVAWYFNGSLALSKSALHAYDGVDLSNKIVAVYVGVDGTEQRVDGASALMLKKDANGNTVSSLTAVGKYTLSLAATADYEFTDNSFTYTVAEKLNSNLTYEEDDEIILGVSSDEGFEIGTEVVVERVEDVDLSGLDGKVGAALNIKFVKDSVEVSPTGIVTVQVLVPDELRNGKQYKLYNLNNGVAKEVKFTVEGDYAVFASDELSTVLFVTQESGPINIPNSGSDKILIDGMAFMWLWVFLAVLAVCSIVSTVVIVVSKRKK